MDRNNTDWIARKFKYSDGVPWNDDRYEIFFRTPTGNWASVGGAIRNWKQETIAFLCTKSSNRIIRTPLQAQEETGGLYVWGSSVMEALIALKEKYPNPREVLKAAVEATNAAF